MSKGRKKARPAKKPETDLFGDPVRSAPPLRKVVPRPDGRGWCIAVRELGGTTYRYQGIYATRGKAWQAIREEESGGDVEIITVIVRRLKR